MQSNKSSAFRSSKQLRRDALAIFNAAIQAADAANAIRRTLSIHRDILQARDVRLPLANFDRIFVVAVGKAAVAMSSAIEMLLGPRINSGLAVTKHGHAVAKLQKIQVLESAHPIPDKQGLQAAAEIRSLLAELNARDLLIVAVSGGASALLPSPCEGIALADKQKTTDFLLRAGANISELNAVRKHLSTLKGGGLAKLAYPATVLSLLLSDVIGDPLDVIGSGLTAPDPTTFADARAILQKFGLQNRVPVSVRKHLAADFPETPKPGDPLFENVHNVVVGSNSLALSAAAAEAKKLGYRPVILTSALQGETREAARIHAQILREIVNSGNPTRPPACLLSGGETTVTVRGHGKGGRNQEFALAAAVEIAGLPNAAILSAGTDGTDGPTDAAGAIADGATVARAQKLRLEPAAHLAHNDSYPFFEALGDLITTGPTGTNVMDVHLLLAGKS